MTALSEARTTETTPDRRRRPGGRDPAQTLYEHAAALLAAAKSMEATAHTPGVEAAAPATLACLETSLAALATAVGRLRGHALERLSGEDDDLSARRSEIAHQLERLAGVLDQGAFACGGARRAIDPVIADLRAA